MDRTTRSVRQHIGEPLGSEAVSDRVDGSPSCGGCTSTANHRFLGSMDGGGTRNLLDRLWRRAVAMDFACGQVAPRRRCDGATNFGRRSIEMHESSQRKAFDEERIDERRDEKQPTGGDSYDVGITEKQRPSKCSSTFQHALCLKETLQRHDNSQRIRAAVR